MEDRLAYLLGHEPQRPFALGSLSLAWPTLSRAQTPADLRAALAGSSWGDPGSDEPVDVHVALGVAWARRVLAEAPEARAWVGGALALLPARGLVPGGGARVPAAVDSLLGSAWRQAQTVRSLATVLPNHASWALEGVDDPQDLWRAEAAWWERVERDAEAWFAVTGKGAGLWSASSGSSEPTRAVRAWRSRRPRGAGRAPR